MDNTLESPRPIFGARECLMLPAALCLGILWRNVFTLEGLANLAFGPHPGPALGAALNGLLARVVDGSLENRREVLLAAAVDMKRAAAP